jgi:general secretion pathway protein J
MCAPRPALRKPALSRRLQRGFTLIEMLVALAIFAILSAAGVLLLRASIATQTSVSARLDDSGAINRLTALLSRELATAQPRPSRDAQGQLRPALDGKATSLAFVHGSAANDSGPAIARTSYALDANTLVRRNSAALDGASDGDPAILLRNVTRLALRYRRPDGSWSDRWNANDAARLPVAVELTLQRGNSAPLTMRFIVAPDGLAPEGSLGGLT